jgi:hypothetical protein
LASSSVFLGLRSGFAEAIGHLGNNSVYSIPYPFLRYRGAFMSEQKICVVKLIDQHEVEHSVKVRAESVYEAALKGLTRLEKVGWEGDGQIAWVTVEIYETPTVHRVNVAKMLQWIRQPGGRSPKDVARKEKLRAIVG